MEHEYYSETINMFIHRTSNSYQESLRVSLAKHYSKETDLINSRRWQKKYAHTIDNHNKQPRNGGKRSKTFGFGNYNRVICNGQDSAPQNLVIGCFQF